MFSKRHYEFIAQTIRTSSVCNEELNQIANEFADRLAKDNPKFNRDRFVDACVPRNTHETPRERENRTGYAYPTNVDHDGNEIFE